MNSPRRGPQESQGYATKGVEQSARDLTEIDAVLLAPRGTAVATRRILASQRTDAEALPFVRAIVRAVLREQTGTEAFVGALVRACDARGWHTTAAYVQREASLRT